MSFKETPRFPTDISYSSSGGPEYATNILVVNSGHEQRSAVWTYPRHKFDVAYGIKTNTEMETLLAYFHVAQGMLHSFRYKDWSDYKSCGVLGTVAATDQAIGTGDSTDGTDGTAAWQLIKTYTSGSTKTRQIQKPVSGALLVAVDAATKTETTHYTVDYTTGIITFTAGNVPLTGEAITAGYEFDVPVRFDTDYLSTDLVSYQLESASVPLIEVKI